MHPKAVSRKKIEAPGSKDLCGGTLASYLTVGDLIHLQKEKEVEIAVAAEAKEREGVEKKAKTVQKRLQGDEKRGRSVSK